MMEPRFLPPGQQPTRKFPVEGERFPTPEAFNLDSWRLEVTGEVETPLSMTWKEFQRLPQVTEIHDIHCVTRWSKPGSSWTGVRFGEIAARARPKPTARFVRFIAYSERDHDTSLPLRVCLDEGVLLVTAMDGEPLKPEHGYPLRVLAPSRYLYKSLKWVWQIVFQAEDTLGFWERQGYHNNADPSREERFTEGNMTAAEAARLRASGDITRHGGKPFQSVDLRGTSFAGKDLTGVVMKCCDLRETDFRGARLVGSNLTNSRFDGADLRGANLSEADLSGVSLVGADLRGCLMRGACLHAAEFVRPDGPPAQVLGLDLGEADLEGLGEAQEEFLKTAGLKNP